MKPVSPVLPSHPESRKVEVVFAENQDEYGNLPGLYIGTQDEGRPLLTRWELSDDEVQEVVKSKSVYVTVWTFNRPLLPLALSVTEPGGD